MLMRISRRRTRSRAGFALRCAVASLALAACDGTSDPSGVAGRYTAHTVNGRRPPATVWAPSFSGWQEQAVNASVRLESDGDLSVEVATRLLRSDSTLGEVVRSTYTGTYQQNGDLLEIGWLQGPEYRVRADGVVISPREVGVTLRLYQYPLSIIARR